MAHRFSTKDLQVRIAKAIEQFWHIRHAQQQKSTPKDTGNRRAVTGGKQLDGFIELLVDFIEAQGIPKTCIITKGGTLPGFFRVTKNWDLLVISPKGQLVVVIELKSQVGSFGNNFNNRTEEALGSAVDLWTAHRESAFTHPSPPWLGYLLVVERSPKSTQTVGVRSPHFAAFPEFSDTSYLERYDLLCQKLMLERHYNAAALLWTEPSQTFGSLSPSTALETFLQQLAGHLHGHAHTFNA